MNSSFVCGALYSHEAIMRELRVGNSGGIRVAKDGGSTVARIVLFSTSEQESNPQENPYKDSEDGCILTYTGTGKIGEQSLAGQNLQLTRQGEDCFPIYVFSLHRHRKASGSPAERWRFAGIYKYLDHSRQNQTDLLGSERGAWIFKFLRLSVAEGHPETEILLRDAVRQAFADPLLSSSALLGESVAYSAIEIGSTVTRMNALAPIAFEHLVKQALLVSRFREVRVTKQSADGGVDVMARMPASVWPVGSQLIQVQAKRWQRPVGRREVAELRGSLEPRALGVLITTGNCARTAIVEADRPNLLPISLIDGYRFAVVALSLKLDIA